MKNYAHPYPHPHRHRSPSSPLNTDRQYHTPLTIFANLAPYYHGFLIIVTILVHALLSLLYTMIQAFLIIVYLIQDTSSHHLSSGPLSAPPILLYTPQTSWSTSTLSFEPNIYPHSNLHESMATSTTTVRWYKLQGWRIADTSATQLKRDRYRAVMVMTIIVIVVSIVTVVTPSYQDQPSHFFTSKILCVHERPTNDR